MAFNQHRTIDDKSFEYVFVQNQGIPLKTYEKGVLRCNVFLPKDAAPFGDKVYPVIATYGSYGKDVPYESFYKKSWSQLNPQMKSAHSAWETPDPRYRTGEGYIVVRVDERGSGQSPGLLDTMSRGTSEAFYNVVEWRPKGLAAVIPIRRASSKTNCDYCEEFGWENGVQPNQYGMPGRAARKWVANRRNQMADTTGHKYMDEEYYRSRGFDLASIEVPLLSVANWGDILLHLRGNAIL
ncbi:uncharacterized protein Z518_00736 [Rhinocladiella mackenziei CBS 650.93]|uniref:Xaa-Pro dipeptidyl-peptidase-like domain-containing protein n=1 Tax=Rhinocladiella mackenziei CBS 650.93 TaxID=1442369 RepID=A0A0D2JJN2_9EURO|nr:uncharacterized protein Z518_00736 [Rhinocladiella mackenziei CBS 650.93]KIX09655.1 hypothetical protein Z518_00736 [Rhinocladiella mackenziei CBS 650.93]